MKRTRNILGIIRTRNYQTDGSKPFKILEYFPYGVMIFATQSGEIIGIKNIPETKSNKIPLAYWKLVARITGRYKKTWIRKPDQNVIDKYFSNLNIHANDKQSKQPDTPQR